MTVSTLGSSELRSRLRSGDLRLKIGPFLVRLQSSMPAVHACVETLYQSHSVESCGNGAHFNLRVDPPSLLRRVYRAQAQFTLDGHQKPFIPLPARLAVPMFEAGLNWCVGNQANQFLVIHSATLERHGRAVIMPAPPGSGKSTLCAALATRGWRLLSDEFALIEPATGLVVPVPRPVALKDRSIDLISEWAPDARFGPSLINNEKQLLAFMQPPAASVVASGTRCPAGLIVIPEYVAGAETTATPLTRARTVVHLADNSFNYNLHGQLGFECLAELAGAAPCVRLRYARLHEGVAAVDELAQWSSP